MTKTVYTYDDLSHLLEAKTLSDGDTYKYQYDPVGNRTKQTINGVVTNYTYDTANRLATAGG